MDLKEISDDMPRFECDIDPVTFSRLGEADRLLASTMSILRQEVRYLNQKVVIAHNLAIQHEAARRSFMGIPTKFIAWLISAAGGALVVKFIEGLK